MKTKSRSAASAGGSGLVHAEEFPDDPIDESDPQLMSLGAHASGPSQTMEHACFKEIMDHVNRMAVAKHVRLRMVPDGDLSLGAAALRYASITELGADRRHFGATFKKRLMRIIGGEKPSGRVFELCDRIQSHFRWCCYIGMEQKWDGETFDKFVVQCISHGIDHHESCHAESLCHKSGRGLEFKVSDKVAFTSLSENGRRLLREKNKAVLQRECFQKVLVREHTGVNESFHIHESFQCSSNFKSGNVFANAEVRRHLACLTWNKEFEFTWGLVLSFVFGNRDLLSTVDWANLRTVDQRIAPDRRTQ